MEAETPIEPATQAATEPATQSAATQAIQSPTTLPITTAPVVTIPITPPSAAQERKNPILPKPFATVPVTQPTVSTPATIKTSRAATAPALPPASQPAAQAAPPLHPAPPTTNPLEQQGDAALAENFSAIAQMTIPPKVSDNDLWSPIFQQVSALLQATVKLAPTEPRFSRLLTDALLRLHDTDGAIQSLDHTRKIDPADQFAQVTIIDLYTSRMETATAKIAYLKDLLGRPTVPDAVRSHAGVVCAKLLVDRGEVATARKVLAEALRFNPSSNEGLRLRYEMLPADVSNFERSEALMTILKANPAQPTAAAALANNIAATGLVRESLPWFDLGLNLYIRSGRPDLNFALQSAAELFIADQNLSAERLVDQIIRADENDPAPWFLKLLVTHSSGNDDAYHKVMQQATNVMCNRVVDVVNEAAVPGAAKATTRPITSDSAYPLPDLGPTVAKIKKDGSSQLRDDFIRAASDLAMLDIYFAQQPASATSLISALRAVDLPSSTTVARLQGWSGLISGKTADARTQLSSVADRDPLAELGLIKLTAANQADQQTAASMGRKLISDHPSGLVGAILWDGLRDLRVKIVPSNQADALRQELDRFPKDWLRVVEQPQTFYAIHAEPLAVSRQYSEPMLARVTIQNLTDNDLTIGSDGLLHRDLWMNAQVRGAQEQQFGGTAYDRIAGPLVLKGRQGTTQIVRLDQGVLAQFLAANPGIAAEVTGSLVTNPAPGGSGQITVGPGGYAVQFSKIFSRTAAPLSGAAPQKALTDLSSGSPQDKIDALNLLTVYVKMIRSAKDANDQLKQAAVNLADAIHQARTDANPAVSAWAGYMSINLADADETTAIIRDLAEDPDWRHRQVALIAIGGLRPDVQKELATKLSADPEPSVRASAEARLAFLEAAAKAPVSQPAPKH
jgi:tetratricopeptide (TPR) repeat protein